MRINFGDAQQALGFLAPQLLRINTEIDYQEYPDFDFARYMFVNTDGGMWAYGSIFYSGDIAGRPEWLDGAGFDMPYADISTTQFLQENHLAGIGYEWHRQELERAAMMGRQLGPEKARAARTVADAKVYMISMRGDTQKNMTGLLNNPNVPTANVPANGAGASTLFANKTADQINGDINDLLDAPFNSTLETKRANTLILPSSRLQYLARTRIGDGTDTILKFVKENNSYTLETGQPLAILGSREAGNMGAGGTARMMAYSNTREVVQLYLPGPHEFFDPYQKGSFTWEVPGLFNVGGVEFRRPKGAAYRDGI